MTKHKIKKERNMTTFKYIAAANAAYIFRSVIRRKRTKRFRGVATLTSTRKTNKIKPTEKSSSTVLNEHLMEVFVIIRSFTR